eukprot:CAMPEP_0179206646 /NCGR_PEP_ID=MMETSP0796-20121207/103040_1 /TAXON_ID=73915 /ORGANISM="Pyrodinium bahamense, Strain pbaha01" /LENGTH=489 /DNA_ID=CAMNT_0020911569 /DNA_START=6 /DNA_END=1472 /DNA_ORIENTATION=-
MRAGQRRRVASCSWAVEGVGGATRTAVAVGQRWAEIPQDLSVLVCQCLGPVSVLSFAAASRRAHELGLREELWRFFCLERWGSAANLHAYEGTKDLYLDCNGWFPQRCGRRQRPFFEVRCLRLHNSPCLTMDLRITEHEIIAVSEAPRGSTGSRASVQIIDTGTRGVREQFEVSDATINCCDIGPNLVCLGSDDSKVRLYRRSHVSGTFSSASDLDAGYRPSCEYICASEVNDLRFAREDAVIAVRTHQNRHPAGLDLIPLGRPDVRISFPGGSWATRGKYIHALDGFEEGCSLSGVACSGEHPLTSAFSAMLFDFRRPAPCVVDLPVTSVQQGHPIGTMLWPLRAGRSPKVYANLLHEEGRRQGRGTIAMVDFRYPSSGVCVQFQLPSPVDDFRCFGDSIYAACTDAGSMQQQRLRVHRCSPSRPGAAESLCTVVEAYDAGGRSPREDLKVFSVCPRGFAVSYGEYLALGTIAEPRWPGIVAEIAAPC